MSLSALFSGVSGLNSNSNAMQVVSNNIANMNTVGFKGSKSVFAEMVGTSGKFQVGRGSRMNSIAPVFTQGSFETSANPLDLGIEGGGFFVIKDSTGTYYSRAGQFKVNKDGNLVNSEDMILQGKKTLDSGGTVTEAEGGLRIPSNPFAAKATANIQINANLDSRATIPSSGFDITDAANTSNFSTAITSYDSLGRSHLTTVYFRKAFEGTANNTFQWFAVVGANDNASGNAEIQSQGNVVFDSNGALAAEQTPLIDDSTVGVTDPTSLVSFTTGTTAPTLSVTVGGTAYTISNLVAGTTLNGLKDAINTSANWPTSTQRATASVVNTGTATTPAYRLMLTSNSNSNATAFTYTAGAGGTALALNQNSSLSGGFDFVGGATQNQAITFNYGTNNTAIISGGEGGTGLDGTTQFAATSAALFQNQDGYSTGTVQSISIADDGTITGLLTNGQTKELGQVALAIFANPSGLTSMGNNRYAESLESGQALASKPKAGAAGRVISGSLEMSNVDLGEEFIKMIILQRGFQANSRVITTNDDILAELVNIKR